MSLAKKLLNRDLPKLRITKKELSHFEKERLELETMAKFSIPQNQVHYFLNFDSLENSAYKTEGINIKILKKDGSIVDLITATDNEALSQFTQTVTKYYTCAYV